MSITKKAVDITSIDYSKYGILYNLSGKGRSTNNTSHSIGDGWDDTDTNVSLLDTPGSLGRTMGTGTPFTATVMERHLHTQEAQIPIEQPIVFCMAPMSEKAPDIEDVIPVILSPGYVFVFHRGTWHSSSHGLNGASSYFWQALVYVNEPSVWCEIDGGPIDIV